MSNRGQQVTGLDYLGVRFVVTSNAKIYASLGLSGADVYGTLFIGKNAYGITELDAMAAQTYFVPATPTKTDPLAQYVTMLWVNPLWIPGKAEMPTRGKQPAIWRVCSRRD